MWLQLIVVPPQLYISECPSISEVGLEVRSEVQGVQIRAQRCQRSVSEMSVKDDFQIGVRRLCYMSFILQSKILIKVGVSVSNLKVRHVNEYNKGYNKTSRQLRQNIRS